MMFLVALLLVIASLLVALWGLGKTILGLVKSRPRVVYRGLALICGSIAVGGYALGIAMVGLAQGESDHGTESSPAPACRQADPSKAPHVIGHEAGYLPLRFDCELTDGTTYSAHVVPSGLTPVVLIAAAATAGLATAAKSGAAHGPSGGANDRYRGSATA
ncbi:hypothetical protein GCM10009745_16290 [Kribbella yunnanensis]|uniref:Integral membrane protein n=1 Tax=Kribbella yunnanensis TaxID=190194 RepID=A0ABP4SJU1_9ACTN